MYPFERLWTVEQPDPDPEFRSYFAPPLVIWDAPNAEDLRTAYAKDGWRVRGPYVLEASLRAVDQKRESA